MGRLDGKVVIVSGGARGIGAAACRRFVAEGACVVIADVLEAEGEALATETGALFIPHDVTNEESWRGVIGQTLTAYGRVTGLVNSAGILIPGSMLTTDLESYRRVIDVNQVGVFLGMRAVAPAMAETGGGAIVNISSAAGFRGTARNFAYTASKWAVRGMSRSAALELAPLGIRVNSVHPGPIDTPMVQHLPAGVAGSLPDIPLKRRGRPEEVATLLLFLISDESSYCTGAEFVIDGGMLAGW